MILFFLIVILKDPRGPKKALGQKYNHKRQLIKSPIKKTEKLTFLYKQQCSPHCRHGRQGRIPPEQHFVLFFLGCDCSFFLPQVRLFKLILLWM